MTKPWQRANTDWMRDAKFGVMTHTIVNPPGAPAMEMSPQQWNKIVDAFDAQAFARTIADTGAGYLFFTIGQNSGYYCSPNETYDGLVKVTPSRLSRRDLVGEVAAALKAKGVRTIAYLPSHAPSRHHEAIEGLRCTPEWDGGRWGLIPGSYLRLHPVDQRLTEFQRNWEAVIREWSLRWGDNVSGWWIDGCYYADIMYRSEDEPNFRTFAQAMKAGNPDSLVAFNPGVKMPIICVTEYEDYTAGEVNDLPTPHHSLTFGRFVDGAQLQVLSFLGQSWCIGQPRFPDAMAVEYTRFINSVGGAVTWDVPVDLAGNIPDAFLRQLAKMK